LIKGEIMAKTEENENLESQETETKKEPKASGGLGLVPILAIVFGSLLILILATRFLFLPYIVENMGGGGKKPESTEVKETEKKPEAKGPFAGVDKKLIKYIETGRITTNPLNSDQFVVVNLGLRFYATDEKILKELMGEGKEGAGLPPEIMGQLRGKVNQILGSLTVAELQQRRNQLANEFKDSLKTIFSSHELVLGEVYLQEFIIQ
jgi:flagellar basal body-associated protein FliL